MFQEKIDFIWSVADLLHSDYKASEYGRVILPLTVLRQLDCMLEPTKTLVLEGAQDPLLELISDSDPVLEHYADRSFSTVVSSTSAICSLNPQHVADKRRAGC